jgi:hypothetical protein
MRLFARLIVLVVIATSLARPAEAAPKPLRDSLSAGAKKDYLEGRLLFEDGDVAGALVKFEEAYAASKDPRLLWNEAVCEKSQRHYASVRALIAKYLQDGGNWLSAADRKEATELAEAIEPFTMSVTLRVSEPGAEVRIDGRVVGTAPLAEPIVVDIGVRHVQVKKSGFREWDQSIALGGSKTSTVDVVLARAQGRLEVSASPLASVTIDDKLVGTGAVAIALPIGGYVLRVTQPGHRAFQTEIVIEDDKTRAMTVRLESAEGDRTAELHVAVGCGDSAPRTLDTGMTIDVDGERQKIAEAVQGYSDEEQRSVVDFLRVPVRPGKHRVRVAIDGCIADEALTISSDDKPGILRGSLERARHELMRGPAGTPDRLRLGVGLLTHVVNGELPASRVNAEAGLFVGAIGSAGIVTRWFVGVADFGISTGELRKSGQSPISASHYVFRTRFGMRFPFHWLAVSAGSGLSIDVISETYVGGVSPLVWGAVDPHPFCEWLLPITTAYTPIPDTNGSISFEIGLAFQPNRECKRERTTVHGL